MVKEEDSNTAVIRLGGGLVYGGDLTVVSLASLRCYILYTSSYSIYNIQRVGGKWWRIFWIEKIELYQRVSREEEEDKNGLTEVSETRIIVHLFPKFFFFFFLLINNK